MSKVGPLTLLVEERESARTLESDSLRAGRQGGCAIVILGTNSDEDSRIEITDSGQARMTKKRGLAYQNDESGRKGGIT